MRYFAHDGKTVHGPAILDELMELPGFDGDTLVCPVGSENSADWKPALAYPSFRDRLLAPTPKPPPPAPATIAPAATSPCPRCGRLNAADARYCNACAARMDGTPDTIAPVLPPAPVFTPAPAPMAAAPAFVPEPEPAASLTPLEPVAVEPAPAPVETPSYEPAPEPLADLTPAAPPEPEPAPSAAWRKPLIASFAGAAIASGALGWWLLRPAKKPAAPAVPGLEMPAAPEPAATPAPVAAPAPVNVPAPEAPAAAPAAPAPAAALPAAKKAPKVDLNDLTKVPEKAAPPAPKKKPRRKAHVPTRKPKPAPAPAPENAGPADDETLIESHTAANEPAMPGGAPSDSGDSAAAPADAAPAPQEDRGFLLPGVPRRPSATKPKAAAAPAASPAASPASPAAAAAGDAAATPAPEDPTSKQVREQFNFCAQLLAQGAFADHFDTCLCADARSAAPYHGRRGFYATSMKKAATAGTLATNAVVKGIVLDGPVAKVTAAWTSGASEKPRTETESWQLEDGLWCRFP